ncbi:N,N-dimethylformamidase beta subunit family domain-containing protein [Pseudaquabacterium pictum]|uniref:N,N-dimethylformamidase n=1 Tax=Pseudaquabacterium pictum TaxID=2315236 RepID=A0A480AKY3_9BURK|nr:N,N-dimethylformamidase beta subunit family domain-containing protein [Rubrivivax pictus]GCL62379.1 N,N-dimethylformamidase [Rubrivivax pictus]
MLPLAGYAERLSARPGQTLRFHVANATGAPVSARVVRVRCADPNPAIGGVQTEPVDIAVEVLATPGPQPVPLGSYAVLGPAGLLGAAADCTAALLVQPTLALPRRQVLLSTLDDQGRGLQLELTPARTVRATVGTSTGPATLETDQPLPLHAWTDLTLVVDSAARMLTLSARPLAGPATSQAVQLALAAAPVLQSPTRCLSLASASDTAPVDCFNGRLEAPVLLARALPTGDTVSRPAADDPACIAAWDFALEMHSQRVVDTGPHAHHGRLVNTPTRAVCGARWTGQEHCFRHAPAEYGAIHFHDDDLDDCRWPATHAVHLPAGLKSDAYALLLQAGDAAENIPFFVVPPLGRPTAKIAVLVSTYTYTIYGNHARPEWMIDPAWRADLVAQNQAWGAYPYNPGEHRDYGLSTYNYHSDGSGIALVSWRRPMLNLRVGYVTYPYPEIRGSGLRHYPADSHLLLWLAQMGHEVDLITDDELHREGQALLAPYKAVLTGSHPEYHTPQMLDALQAFRDNGGRLAYLGGNGFYWKIALDPVRDGLIEIRRGEGGIRAWAAEPGEYFQQFDGQYGGLWRRNARPPQKLVGVGFTAQGNFVGSHYRIDPAARSNPRVSWLLEGVAAETVGGEGFSGHGAAGFELDRVDTRLGSPANAVVVARSENHPPEAPWVLVPEEQLTHITTIPGQPHKALIRADMTWFDCPGGGEVFAVGSITFCGALPVNGGDNDISRILDNVVRRFSR